MVEKIIIVVPIYDVKLKDFEIETLNYNRENFKKYDVVIISPNNLSNNLKLKDYKKMLNAKVEFFENKYFKSTNDYNKLMLSKDFYKRFISYEYMLICQLDAVLLKTNIENWCKKNIDYIGAPWFSKINGKYVIDSAGNGGFSLRNIRQHYEVLNSKSIYIDDDKLNNTPLRIGLKNLVFLKLFGKLSKIIKFKIGWVDYYKKIFSGNEDYFWALSAVFFVEKFNVANNDDSLKFAYEKYVEVCLEFNKGEYPTGIHAWQKYNKTICKELIEKAKKV